MRRSTLLTLAVSVAAFGATASAAFAHHSAAMFDSTKTRVLDGVVQDFNWTNPHGYLQLNVTTSTGRVQKWSIEFQSLVGMTRQGLRPTSFKPGDKVQVTVHPLRNGTTGGDFVSGVLADGTKIAGGA